jgi:hypothetical protein
MKKLGHKETESLAHGQLVSGADLKWLSSSLSSSSLYYNGQTGKLRPKEVLRVMAEQKAGYV